jgi:DNA (cytosine-5)-methyltransferase 1
MAVVVKKPKIVVYPRIAVRRRGPSCIDLFSGAGGLAVGFRQAGWSILAANDLDKDAGETFRLNFPEATFFEGAVSELTSAALLKECGLKAGELDCLIGGPPCQSFSYNNHQRSAEDVRAQLFRDYLRLVAEMKPKTLVMENVPGILTIGDNKVVTEISERLAALGYKVSVKILSAEEFGTPQTRRRVFIVASRVGDPMKIFPVPSHRDSSRYAKKAEGRKPRVKRPVTVGQAIGDLPRLRSGGGKQVAPRPKKKSFSQFQRLARKGAKELYNHLCHDLTPVMIRRIKHVPEGGNWRDIPRHLLTAGMRRARKSDHTKRYGRLDRDGQASTLLTKCDPHWGAYVHPTQNRTISVREAARLQGFPDVFRFAGESTTKQYSQVGNAVPVQLAHALGALAATHIKRGKRALAAAARAKARIGPKGWQLRRTRRSISRKNQSSALRLRAAGARLTRRSGTGRLATNRSKSTERGSAAARQTRRSWDR